MLDTAGPGSSAANLRAGLRVSAASIVSTLATSSGAVVLGVGASSLVLVAFGVIGVLDAVGSATLVAHFRHALRHQSFSERHERLALRVITLGMVGLGAATGAESAHRLVAGAGAAPTPVGVALAASSALVLALLSLRKRVVARAIPSRALLADSFLSAAGALLAVVTVAGTALGTGLRWRWVDPLAAAVVGGTAVVVGLALARS